ncbi:MAG: lipoyl synthase [Bdellovibrionota bacterium]
MTTLQVIDRQSPEEFSKTLEAQTNLLEAKVSDSSLPDYLILVEHQPVYTSGRGEPFQTALTGDVPWHEIGRGGKATFHGPGQLVAYPIFDLNRHGRDVHVYLRKLEEAGIACLARFGIQGYTRAGLTGIWTRDLAGEQKKIASMGIGVRKWVSYHGVALNVTTDLSYFRAISPCGQSGELMTSLAELLTERGEQVPSMDAVKDALIDCVAQTFELEAERPAPPKPLPERTRPEWLKAKAPGSGTFLETNQIVRDLKLVTVCEEARCPNIGECWSHRTATFMIMGELCTRRCSFCSVRDGTLENLSPLDPLEPYRVGKAIAELGLKHVVITSVNRDDVPDMGAAHFDQTVRAIAAQNPGCKIELLIPDMRGKRDRVETILRSGLVSVLNHNVETVPRLYRTVRPGAIFQRSLDVLFWAKEVSPTLKTKSGVMVGLGEKPEEILEVMDSLRSVGVEILTVGQYLQPTEKQLPIERYVTPAEFDFYKNEGLKRGFSYVESAPLVRSSYHAWQHSQDPAEESALPL